MKLRKRKWCWVELATLLAVHDRLISEHGGLGGVRDHAMLESAMARPRHLEAYEKPDAADLAAAYAFGLARNHGFVDGNKRAAWTVARLFLRENEFTFTVSPVEAVLTVERLAAGVIDQDAFAAWIRERLT